jgi:hypothetical protein
VSTSEETQATPEVAQSNEIFEEILERRVETYQKEDVQPKAQPMKKKGLFNNFGFGKKR